jgi:hypothetical protein
MTERKVVCEECSGWGEYYADKNGEACPPGRIYGLFLCVVCKGKRYVTQHFNRSGYWE